MAGIWIVKLPHVYFTYGSNMSSEECRRTATDAEDLGIGFLPGFRLAFTKHSITRQGDAATIAEDATSMVWGFTYRVSEEDRKRLGEREGGYEERKCTVYLPKKPGEKPRAVEAFTFVATSQCPNRCGPPSDYLELILQGAKDRDLPRDYQQFLSATRK